MWTGLAFFAASLALTPQQAVQPAITHVRSLCCYFGPERENNKVLPGDRFLIVFDIEGLKSDKDGRMAFAMSMEVVNSQGKIQYAPAPENAEYYDSLGGRRVPASAHVDVLANQPTGKFTLKLTVTDKATKMSQQMSREFEVLPKDFGIVRCSISNEVGGRLFVPLSGLVGEERWLNFHTVGFDRDPTMKQPAVFVQMQIFDENGKPTSAKPFTGGVDQNVPDEVTSIPMQFRLPLNRPGKFTVELQATDRVSKKTAKRSFAFVVTEQK